MSNDNDNPWGSDQERPKRQEPPRRPSPETQALPDPLEIFRRGRESFGGFNGGSPFKGQNGMGGLAMLAAIAVVIWGLSGFYRVDSDQMGIELTFGKWSNQTNPAGPGLHYHLPSPIGSVETPVVTRENRITVGFDATGGNFLSSRSARRDVPEESLMLTSDENIVDIDFLVFWRIKDPAAYLFNTRNPDDLTKRAAESVMREIVAQRPFMKVMAERADMEKLTMEKMQILLDEYKVGVLVQNVQLLDVLPPPQVVDAFNDVQRAQTEKVRLQNEAETYQNNIVPRARGLAEQLRQQASAYKAEVVSRAKGDATRFSDVYKAYRQSPDVTAKRMYLETMEEVLAGANKVILNKDGGVVPYFPLPSMGAADKPKSAPNN